MSAIETADVGVFKTKTQTRKHSLRTDTHTRKHTMHLKQYPKEVLRTTHTYDSKCESSQNPTHTIT